MGLVLKVGVMQNHLVGNPLFVTVSVCMCMVSTGEGEGFLRHTI